MIGVGYFLGISGSFLYEFVCAVIQNMVLEKESSIHHYISQPFLFWTFHTVEINK